MVILDKFPSHRIIDLLSDRHGPFSKGQILLTTKFKVNWKKGKKIIFLKNKLPPYFDFEKEG